MPLAMLLKSSKINRMPHKTFLLLTLSLLLASCGTITSRNKFLGLDSEPRGLEVRDKKDSIYGFTPMIMEKPNRKDKFYIGKEKHEFIQTCQLDWRHSLLPNAFITAINPIAGGVFYGVDFFNDKLKQCDSTYLLNIEGEKKTQLQNRYVILPTTLIDDLDWKQVEAAFEKELGGEIIPYEEGYKVFNHYGLYQSRDIKSKNVSQEVLLKVGQQLRMSHFIQIRRLKNQKLVYQRIDFYRPKEKKQRELVLPISAVPKKKSDIMKLAKRNIYFLPNSIGLSFSRINSGTVNHPTGGALQLEHRRKSNFFQNLSQNVSFKRLQHPLLHGEYSFSFQTAPSFLILNTDTKVKSNSTEREVYSTEVDIYALSYNAYVFFHTPVGSFSLGAGYGLGHLVQAPPDNGNRSHNTSFSIGEFAYTAFMTERVFFRFVAESYNFSTGYRIGPGQRWNDIGLTSFTIGYYLPETSNFFL